MLFRKWDRNVLISHLGKIVTTISGSLCSPSNINYRICLELTSHVIHSGGALPSDCFSTFVSSRAFLLFNLPAWKRDVVDRMVMVVF